MVRREIIHSKTVFKSPEKELEVRFFSPNYAVLPFPQFISLEYSSIWLSWSTRGSVESRGTAVTNSWAIANARHANAPGRETCHKAKESWSSFYFVEMGTRRVYLSTSIAFRVVKNLSSLYNNNCVFTESAYFYHTISYIIVFIFHIIINAISLLLQTEISTLDSCKGWRE